MLRFLCTVVFALIADWAFPQVVRTYGIGVFPWGNKSDVRRFSKRYGFVRFPRTALLLFVVSMLNIDIIFPVNIDIQIPVTLFGISLWGIVAYADMLRARERSKTK